MSKRQAKVAINTIDTNLNSTNLVTNASVVNTARDTLLTTLNPSNNFFVDQEVVDKTNKITGDITIKHQDLINRQQTLINEQSTITAEDTSLATSGIPVGHARRVRIATRLAEIATELTNLGTMIGHIATRQGEYQTLADSVGHFDIARNLTDMTTDIYNVNADLMKPGTTASSYEFYNEDGSIVNLTNYWIDIRLADGTTQNVRINGLTINAAGQINAGAITFTTRAGATYIPTQGYQFTIYPGAIITIGTAPNITNLIHSKALNVIRSNPGALNNQALRIPIVNDYNTRVPTNTISNSINNTYTNKFPNLQRESVFDALRHLDGVRFTQLEEYGRKNGKEQEIKEELYQQIYRNFLNIGPINGQLLAINSYNDFRDRFTDNSRNRNKDKEVIKNAISYENYLHNNLSARIEDYIKDELNRLLKNDHANNMRLKTELSRFLTDIESRKNDDERNLGGQTINTAVEGNIGANDTMTKYRRRRVLGIPFGRQDVNYMRFYNGAEHEIKDQSVDISTNTRIIDLNNPEPVKYDIKTEISGKNNITTTVSFPDKDKRYPKKEISLKAGEVSTLTRKILNCPDIRDFKVRTHIVYNMLVSMIKISAKKDLSLRYRVPGTPNQRELVMDDKNITLYERDDSGANRVERNLFDYNAFVTTNTFHGAGNNRSMQTAIDELMGHFNFAMNQYHEGYRDATRSRLLKTKVSANSFWTSPIKTIMNLKTVRKFDFTTTAQSEDGKKSVAISFEKNLITLKMGDIEVKGKNLGKLLDKRINKIRIFDGVERYILHSFYDELVKKLRENSKISRSNFGVRDPLTRNIYIIDEDGQACVVTPEDPGDVLNGRESRIITKTDLDNLDARGGRRICTSQETKELFMNPAIMGRMIKLMNRRM